MPGSESEVQLRSKDIRGFRLPFVGMFSTREHSVMLHIRPPIDKAIEVAWGTAAMERIANLCIKEDMTGRAGRVSRDSAGAQEEERQGA